MAAEEAKAATTAAATTTTEFDPAKWLDNYQQLAGVKDNPDAQPSVMDGLQKVLGAFIQEATKGQVIKQDVETRMKLMMSLIDQKLTVQLNEILHHPDLQKLEGTWRGLHYLVMNSETGELLKIKVLNATKDELKKDLDKAVEFDMSHTFKAIYEDGYGILGGHPYGLLVGDYDYDVRRSPDVKLLAGLAGISAAAHAPIVGAISPKAFNMDRFSELAKPRDLAKIFDTDEYAAWKAFRASDDSRYVALTCPRVLAREVYGEKFKPVEEFNFEENVDGTDHDKYLWMNSAWAYAGRITDAFSKYGWLARTRGVEGGGAVEGLPLHFFPSDDGELLMKCPSEIAITDRREQELEKLGFLSLIHHRGQGMSVFMSATSCRKPVKYNTAEASANDLLSTRFNMLLCVSRFAHFLKVMVRNRIGSFVSAVTLERWLNRWITDYTLGDPDNSPDEEKAKKPLAWAKIEVQDVPGQPGSYKAMAHPKPHFQLESLDISMGLVAKQIGK